jgi:LysM repeat protein
MNYNNYYRNNSIIAYGQYVPVTAYAADHPIYVNGVDINGGRYPVLLFHPQQTQYPIPYVPITDVNRVGAAGPWNANQIVDPQSSVFDPLMSETYKLRQRATEIDALTNTGIIRANELNWQMHFGDQGNTKYSDATVPVQLTLSTNPFTNASSLFSVDQNQLYSVERIEKKILSATDLATNQEKWDFSTDNKDAFLDLIARDGVVYVSTMNTLYAIQDNGTSTQTLWTVNTLANRLLIDQTTLYYYTRDTVQGIAAVDTKTGQLKWKYSLKTNEQVEGVFAAGGNRLYANIRNPVQITSKMYAYDAASGTVLWAFDVPAGNPIYGNPVYKDEKLYIETITNAVRTIWALDAPTGRTLWKFNPTGTYVVQPISVTNDSLIVLDESNVMAIDKNTGTQKWKTMYADQVTLGGSQTISGSRGMLVASDKIIVENANKIKFFNTATGQLISSSLPLSTPTGGVGVRPIGVIQDTIFVTESNQILYTYAVPKPTQPDTVKPTATINLPAVSPLAEDGKLTIPVTISEDSDMNATIVDQSGLVVQTIGAGRFLKGTANFYWDGKNSRGFNVTRGNYHPVIKLTDLAGNVNVYDASEKVIQVTAGFGLTLKNSNLRTAADPSSTILRVIPFGSEVTITGETGDWYQVEYRIVSSVLKGYIAKTLIKVPSNQEILNISSATTRTNVNVRTSAGTQYGTKIVLPMNTAIKIISALGDWYLIEYQKDTIYIDQGYVAKYLVTLPTVSTFIYTVVAGDTLWKISQKFGVTVDSIVKGNNLNINQPLYIGQKLTIVK